MFAMIVEKSVSPIWKVTVVQAAPPSVISCAK